MSAKGQGDPGEDLASRVGAESPCSDMKRAAAKKLIERYFYQLTDGCGNPSCDNQYCASSGKVTNLTANEAAAQAISLFSQDARLCDGVQPSKVARTTLEPGPASLTKSLPNKNVNPTCSVEVITISDSEETKDSDFPTDYSSETDDKSIAIDFAKTMNKNPCDSNKSKNKRRRRKRTAFTKKKNLRKSSNPSKIQQNPESAENERQYLQIHKLITLALFLRYADAKNMIHESKTE